MQPDQPSPREPLRVTSVTYHNDRDLLAKIAEQDRRVVEVIDGRNGKIRFRMVPA